MRKQNTVRAHKSMSNYGVRRRCNAESKPNRDNLLPLRPESTTTHRASAHAIFRCGRLCIEGYVEAKPHADLKRDIANRLPPSERCFTMRYGF